MGEISKEPARRAKAGRPWSGLCDTDDYDRTLTLQDLAWAVSEASGTAIVCGERRLSYEEFHRITTRIACFLAERGLNKGNVVAIHMHRDERLLCAMFGVIKAGAAYLILNTDWPERRLADVVADSGARYVITTSAEETYPEAAALYYPDMAETPSREEDGPVLHLRQRMPRPYTADLAALCYTSGSTGKPKGVMLSHANMVDAILPLRSNPCIREGVVRCSTVLDVVNAAYIASVPTYGASLYTGGKHVLIQTEELEQLLPVVKRMREEKVDFVLMTPSVMTAFLTVKGFVRALSHVKMISLCGEPLSQQLADTLTRCTREGTIIYNLYGATETTGRLSCANVRGRSVTIGKPGANTEVFAVDSEGRRLPDGQIGQLCAKGRRVAMGYHRLSAVTESKFYTDIDGVRVYRTGDMGFINEQGEIELLRRNDRMVKLGGVRFELPEVEHHLLQLPYIRTAAVKIDRIDGHDRLCAVYVSRETVTGTKIRADLEKVLPPAMLPSIYCRVEAMPLTERGKIDYDRLVITVPDTGRGGAFPENETERLLCGLFSRILGTEETGAEMSFFELGGDSIRAFLVLAELKKHGVTLSLRELLKYPTPRSLAALIRGKTEIEESDCGEAQAEALVREMLPAELAGLAGDANTEALLPVNRSTAAYLYLEERGIKDWQNVIRVRFVIRGTLTEEKFYGRVRSLVARHPALRSTFVRDKRGAYWQVFHRRKEPAVWFRDLQSSSKAAADRVLSGFWQVLEERGEAFAAACFPMPDGNSAVLIRAAHTIVDGISLSVIQNELATDGPSGVEDCLLSYRRKHILAGKNISEKAAAYFVPEHPPRKSPEAQFSGVRRARETIRLSGAQTERLFKACGAMGVTLFSLVQLCYGKALLSLLKESEVWLLHLDSGRSNAGEREFRIVGNLINRIPVCIRPDTTPVRFAETLITLAETPGLSDWEKLNRWIWVGIYEGIISRDFGTTVPTVLEKELLEQKDVGGNCMFMKDGCLHIELRHADEPRSNQWYRELRALLLTGLEAAASEYGSEGMLIREE